MPPVCAMELGYPATSEAGKIPAAPANHNVIWNGNRAATGRPSRVYAGVKV